MRKILLLTLLIPILAFSRTAVPVQSGREFQIITHDINNVEMSLSNYGTFGQTEAGDAGLWWPIGSRRNYIYGAGAWFGTIVEDETLVTIGYGPSGGQFEFGCGRMGWSVSDPDAIIFLYPDTWPPAPPANLADVFPEKTLSHQDSWCVYNDGDIAYHMAGDTRPIGLEVYQTVYAWNLSTTADIIFLKFEVRNVTGSEAMQEYYPNGAITLTNCWFGVCTDNDIGNEAGALANDIISGIAGEDRIYVIEGDTFVVNDLGYQWQVAPEGSWDPPLPGAIGFDYLQSPFDLEPGADKDNDGIPDEEEMNEDYYRTYVPDSLWDADQDGTMDWEDPSQIPQMGMVSFKRFTLDLEPGRDNERYVTMEGYDFNTMVHNPYDTVPPDPDDQRFIQCSGPFDLGPDETVTVLVGIVLADWQYPPNQFGSPDSALAQVDATAQFIYDQNWLLPGPPPPPILTCIPGDAQITLIWESVADPTSPAFDPVLAADPYYFVVGWDSLTGEPYNAVLYDSFYLKYDFEGYGVWKSLDGQEWELLTRYDKYNDVVFDDPETDMYATNSGILHYFVDSDVRNGFTYYYAITTFDYNYTIGFYDSVEVVDSVWYEPDSIWIYIADTVQVEGASPLNFECGRVGVSSMPRRWAANFEPGAYTAEALYGNSLLADSNIIAAITDPLQMTDEPFYVDFGPNVYDTSSGNPQHSATLLDADLNAIGDVAYVLGEGEMAFADFGTRNGMSITTTFQRPTVPGGGSIFDRIEVNDNYVVDTSWFIVDIDTTVTPWDTTYGVDSTFIEDWLAPASMAIPTNWAYRGNNYEVHWIKAYGSDSVNSVVVIDMDVGDTIPFTPYLENTETEPLAQGWCFRALQSSSDTLVFAVSPLHATSGLYICGGKFRMTINWLSPDDEPRPTEGSVWTVYRDPDYHPVSANARIQITPTPAELLGVIDFDLNVKVVPNPYIISNEWQTRSIERRVRFINLPAECTIRIFNLNGELVRSITHRHTSEESDVLGDQGGDEWWDVLSDNRQLVASGVYIFHIESDVGEQVGKFVIIR